MIHITQGHEHSISLEVFLRSCLLLQPKQTQLLKLHCTENSLTEHLKWLGYDFTLKNKTLHLAQHQIPVKLTNSKQSTPTMASLLSALHEIKNDDILVTLPTSKDQFDGNMAGHTEFFRSYYSNANLSMTFYNGQSFTCLITDHVPLKDVSSLINEEMIVEKIKNTLSGLERFFKTPKNVIFSGINPHAGEDGRLGNEDAHITKAILKLKKSYKNINFLGPYSGDTLHTFSNQSKESLFVYMHHDQGLAPFKQKNLFWGSNITFGLPFLRLSVDHGTAFDLYGKKKAQFLGCYDVLLTALNLRELKNAN